MWSALPKLTFIEKSDKFVVFNERVWAYSDFSFPKRTTENRTPSNLFKHPWNTL